MTVIYGRSIGRALPRLGALRSVLSCSRFGDDIRYLSITAHRYANSDAKLDLPALDQKWRQRWAALKSTKTSDGAEKKYVLPMFPYPSGYLHLGHLRVYTIADVVARFHSLRGHDVLLPMGWDAFGLPAENAAIERGIDPATWTKSNIAKMKEQLDVMNGSWDWSRELATCDPSFYKHTQKIFLLLREQGLAYQDEAEVNYDPVDKTVLANEQVDANGCSWRSGAKVEKRKLKQWFLRISQFRDSLLQELEILSKDNNWPERVLTMQKNWLGKSTGATIKFPLMAFEHITHSAIEVFTSRPDTLFGVQYLALASTHPVVAQLAAKDPELQAFLDILPGLPPDSKVGYLLPHIRAVNPLAYHDETPEATKRSIPIYVAPYVLGDYGEGAVMGVPAHDVRDHSFWKTHHKDEPVRFVLAASEDESTTAMQNEPFIDHGVMTAHSGLFKGRSSQEAGEMLVRILEEAELAKPVEKWRLRDWLVSRQRYWGTPIPIIHCGSCGAVPVPEEELPVELPEVDEHWAGKKTGNPLETLEEWVNTSCPQCHGPARRDTDTMDTFVDSSWYFARFIDPHNDEVPFSREKARKMLPVDLYIGGIEHAILHLLYSRFIYKFLMGSTLVGETEGVQEPFKRLITQGMVHGKTYTDPATGKFLKPDEVDVTDPARPRVVRTGEVAGVSYEKMSKSKYNGVDPTDVINLHGADATRAHMLFQAPVSEVLDWDGDKIVGVTRWLGRVWELVQRVSTVSSSASVREFFEQEAARLGTMKEKELQQWDKAARVWREVQKTVESVTGSYEKVYALNTVVSDLMILTNVIVEEEKGVPDGVKREAVEGLVRMMAPITPAFAEECWAVLHPGETSIFKSEKGRFPVTDGTVDLLQPRKQVCAVQVNGRLKFAAEIAVPPEGLGEEQRREWVVGEVLKTEEGRKKFEGVDVGKAKKVVVVKGGKLVNFVM
ncbi:coenzyme A transporter [Podospora pseudocomata]|uniref:leucine--tRNA ligase n=1 Tax=Podospora pseudocomata TaxID=2093779 RepID=A0ABR0GN17_9PEZI|nr:coenzyme A transporter [Podospora pseudocomata]